MPWEQLSTSSWTLGNWLALAAVVLAVLAFSTTILALVWKIAAGITTLVIVQTDHSRRLEVIEAATLNGPAAGRLAKARAKADGRARVG